MSYKIGEWGRVKTDFKRAFGLDFKDFYDPVSTIYMFTVGKSDIIYMDLVKFGDFILSKYPQEYENSSMQELILNKYGEYALRVAKALNGVE